MRLLVVSAVFVAAVSTAAAAPIVGGTPTKLGDYPTVVAITVGDGLCTGILIDKEWVITAAHCMDPSIVGEASQADVTTSTGVFFNTIDINGTARGTLIRASETFHDTRYDSDNTSHDVGLVHLAKPYTAVAPSPLNFDASKSPVGISVTMVGFGTTMTGPDPTTAGVEYVIANQTSIACTSLQLSDANLLCFSQTGGHGKCEGDSGGPSFATIGGVQTVVGLTSFGDPDCTQYGADTRPEADKDFILQHIPGLNCTEDSACATTGSDDICFDRACIAQPFSPTGIGTSCAGDSDCDSASCLDGPGSAHLCAISCTPGVASTCPGGFDCLSAGSDGGACWPSAGGSSGGGCCDAGNGGVATMVVGIGLMGLVLRRRRR